MKMSSTASWSSGYSQPAYSSTDTVPTDPAVDRKPHLLVTSVTPPSHPAGHYHLPLCLTLQENWLSFQDTEISPSQHPSQLSLRFCVFAISLFSCHFSRVQVPGATLDMPNPADRRTKGTRKRLRCRERMLTLSHSNKEMLQPYINILQP